VLQFIMKHTNQHNGLKDYSFMVKPTFFNILFYLFFKYVVAYVIFMVITSNYSMLDVKHLHTVDDVFYYIWLLLFMPIVSMFIFSLPYFLSFKAKNKWLFGGLISLLLSSEYSFYVYFNSQKLIDKNGLVFSLVSAVVFYFFFYKNIKHKHHL
jgi:hypothetical protein